MFLMFMYPKGEPKMFLKYSVVTSVENKGSRV